MNQSHAALGEPKQQRLDVGVPVRMDAALPGQFVPITHRRARTAERRHWRYLKVSTSSCSPEDGRGSTGEAATSGRRLVEDERCLHRSGTGLVSARLGQAAARQGAVVSF